MTDSEFHRWMAARFPSVKPIGMDLCLFVKKQTQAKQTNKIPQAGVVFQQSKKVF